MFSCPWSAEPARKNAKLAKIVVFEVWRFKILILVVFSIKIEGFEGPRGAREAPRGGCHHPEWNIVEGSGTLWKVVEHCGR